VITGDCLTPVGGSCSFHILGCKDDANCSGFAAIKYAARGWRVLPIKPGEKRPPMRGWQDAATTDRPIIFDWYWDQYPDHGVGVATGRESGVFVLDVDVSGEKRGDETLHELEQRHGPLPQTAHVSTGTGGSHFYFRWPDGAEIRNNAGTVLGAGLDIRGEGGQVVAPPTMHPCGTRYQWEGGEPREIAHAPAWLIELLTTNPRLVDHGAPVTTTKHDDARPNFVSPNSTSPADDYNASITWTELLGGDGWAHETTDGNGTQHWRRPGKKEGEGSSGTVMDHGEGPLTVFTTSIPWLKSKGTAGDGVGSYSRFQYMAARDHAGDYSAAAKAFLKSRPDRLHVLHEQATADDAVSDRSLSHGRADRLRTKIITGPALLKIPEPSPLVRGLLFYETTSMLVGAPKTGKTFLAIDLTLSVITGRDWQGLATFPRTRKVFYLAGEGRRGVMRRVTAWCNWHAAALGVTSSELLAEITDRFVMLPGGLSIQESIDRSALVDIVGEHEPDLVIVDTLARHSRGAEENSSKDMGRYVEAIDEMAEATSAHICNVHHSGKDSSKGARGSSALLGAVDTELTVSGDPQKGGMVKVTAQKDAEPASPWHVRFERAGVGTNGEHLSLVALPASQPPQVSSERLTKMLKTLIDLDGEHGVTEALWAGAFDDQEKNEKPTVRGSFARWAKELERAGHIENVSKTTANRWRPVSHEFEVQKFKL
jgi:hypothetical protein